MIDDTLFFMLVVGLVISAGMLFLFIWAAKSGQFDDASKMTNGMLFLTFSNRHPILGLIK